LVRGFHGRRVLGYAIYDNARLCATDHRYDHADQRAGYVSTRYVGTGYHHTGYIARHHIPSYYDDVLTT
jgi:hypothetical protein